MDTQIIIAIATSIAAVTGIIGIALAVRTLRRDRPSASLRIIISEVADTHDAEQITISIENHCADVINPDCVRVPAPGRVAALINNYAPLSGKSVVDHRGPQWRKRLAVNSTPIRAGSIRPGHTTMLWKRPHNIPILRSRRMRLEYYRRGKRRSVPINLV